MCVLICAWGWGLYRHSLSHLSLYGRYTDAANLFIESGKELPDTVGDLEQAYNAWELRQGTLPPAGMARPDYWPMKRDVGTRSSHVVLCEPKPDAWWFPLRLIVRGSSAGVTHEFVWEWQVARVISAHGSNRMK